MMASCPTSVQAIGVGVAPAAWARPRSVMDDPFTLGTASSHERFAGTQRMVSVTANRATIDPHDGLGGQC